MYGMIRIMVLAAAVLFLGHGNVYAWWGGTGTLLTINNETKSADDFKNWWQNWREEGQASPETVDPYVEWLLLVQEAKRMELYLEPAYQQKVNIFLRARTLLMLKHEEIDAKIIITEKDLREQYEILYSPRLKLKILYFNDIAKAEQVYEDLTAGRSSMDDYKKMAAMPATEVYFQEKELRPVSTIDAWRDIIDRLGVGDISAPFNWERGFLIIKLDERKGFEQEDINRVKERIRRTIWKKRHDELTVALVKKLEKKFAVEVNQDLFDALDPSGSIDDIADQPLISSNREIFTVGSFVEKLRKEQNSEHYQAFKTDESPEQRMEKLKQRTLRGIISQTITTWEALDRHYEENSPAFKPVYQYYTENRLNSELEKRLFLPNGIVSNEEIASYYRQHIDDFSSPEMVNIVVLDDLADKADRIWAEIVTGGDFDTVVRKFFPDKVFIEQSVPLKELGPEIRSEVQKLGKGEVTYPFLVQDNKIIVKLLSRDAGVTMPLENVANMIYGRLQQEKIDQARNDYVAQLKSLSKIDINEKAWKALQEEFAAEKI